MGGHTYRSMFLLCSNALNIPSSLSCPLPLHEKKKKFIKDITCLSIVVDNSAVFVNINRSKVVDYVIKSGR